MATFLSNLLPAVLYAIVWSGEACDVEKDILICILFNAYGMFSCYLSAGSWFLKGIAEGISRKILEIQRNYPAQVLMEQYSLKNIRFQNFFQDLLQFDCWHQHSPDTGQRLTRFARAEDSH